MSRGITPSAACVLRGSRIAGQALRVALLSRNSWAAIMALLLRRQLRAAFLGQSVSALPPHRVSLCGLRCARHVLLLEAMRWGSTDLVSSNVRLPPAYAFSREALTSSAGKPSTDVRVLKLVSGPRPDHCRHGESTYARGTEADSLLRSGRVTPRRKAAGQDISAPEQAKRPTQK